MNSILIAISVVLLGCFLILHVRLEKAARYSKQTFPERWKGNNKHRCLFAVRFTLICLFFNIGYALSVYCNPDFAEFLHSVRDGFFVVLLIGIAGWINDSIKKMSVGRRQIDPHRDLLG